MSLPVALACSLLTIKADPAILDASTAPEANLALVTASFTN